MLGNNNNNLVFIVVLNVYLRRFRSSVKFVCECIACADLSDPDPFDGRDCWANRISEIICAESHNTTKEVRIE